LALPEGGEGRPVLVLHAWWGLNDTIKELCKRLAGAGFTAFAPDLYHGRVTDTIEGATALAKALSGEGDKAKGDVAEAARFLLENHDPDGRGLAVMGFSLGAWYAMELSAENPAVRKVVIFYGAAPMDYSGSQAAYLGHFAADDAYEEPEYVEETEKNLRDAGRPVTFHTYPGTGHWFFEPDRTDAYDPAAAELAWERTLAFLRG
jgi:carboxymethylenebutenolidase